MGELKDEFQEAIDAAGKGDWGTVYDIMAAHKGDSYELGTYIYTYIHTYIHTHTYTHTYIQTNTIYMNSYCSQVIPVLIIIQPH